MKANTNCGIGLFAAPAAVAADTITGKKLGRPLFSFFPFGISDVIITPNGVAMVKTNESGNHRLYKRNT